jgi:hypothetical protein
MTERRYYSVRTGKNPYSSKLDLPFLLRLFHPIYTRYEQRGYFQEAFGYYCIDEGQVEGKLGPDIGAEMLRRLRKPDLWPIYDKWSSYSEDDLFDVVEFLYDWVSKPIDGRFHDYGGCGWHYSTFDREAGRVEFRGEINALLRDYGDGYEVSEDGEVLALPESGMEPLFEQELPEYDPENVESRVEAAKHKFRLHRSSLDDKREAVRALADVLEFLRPKLKAVMLSKDESDLFNIANNFGIRHHSEMQRTDYNGEVWYPWVFHLYLSTIHAVLRLIKEHELPLD